MDIALKIIHIIEDETFFFREYSEFIFFHLIY